MPKRPKKDEVQTAATGQYVYDFKQAERILQALDFLRKEAVATRIPEIVTMVDSTFQLMLTSYYCILRYEMKDLPPSDQGLQ